MKYKWSSSGAAIKGICNGRFRVQAVNKASSEFAFIATNAREADKKKLTGNEWSAATLKCIRTPPLQFVRRATVQGAGEVLALGNGTGLPEQKNFILFENIQERYSQTSSSSAQFVRATTLKY